MKKKLGIILSHPVQYYAPLFRYLAREIDIVVFYGHKPNAEEQGRSGFGTTFSWDIDLLSDYKHVFLQNRSKSLEFNHFNGISVPDVGRILKEHNVSHVLILGWHYRFYLQALWYCKTHGIPVTVRGDSQLTMQGNPFFKLMKSILYPIFLSFYSKILYVGQRNKAYLRHYLVPKSKLLYAPHAVDQDFWKVNRLETGEEIIFLWIGKVIEKKRPEDALKAFCLFRDSTNLKVRLRMIGSGPLHQKCVTEFGNEVGIEFLGFKNQTEIREEFRRASCLLLTSDARETWGLVVNEAFSCGIPAIVSDACGCAPDMIVEGSGITYPVGDVDLLRNAMSILADNLSAVPDYYKKGIEVINLRHHFSGTTKALKDFLHLPS